MANYFTAGLKGRWNEERRRDDHRLTDDSAMVDAVIDGEIAQTEVAALVGLNTDLRTHYIADCQIGINRWNKILAEAGLPHRVRLPHVGFNRKVGTFKGIETTPEGERIATEELRAPPDAVAAVRCGQDVRPVVDAAGVRPGEDRRLDRAADQRHQRKAVRLRVRAPVLTPTDARRLR